MTYPTPATPLPWCIDRNAVGYRPDIAACHIWTAQGSGFGLVATTVLGSVYPHSAQDAAYIIRAANAFPHLVAALEAVVVFIDHFGNQDDHELIFRALAIARGEVTP